MKVNILLLAIFLALATPAFATEESFAPAGVASRCMDGDTFQMADRRMIRLSGIDAPELPRGSKTPQYYSRQARQALESLVQGKTVTLSCPGLNLKDRHGR